MQSEPVFDVFDVKYKGVFKIWFRKYSNWSKKIRKMFKKFTLIVSKLYLNAEKDA